MKTAATAASVAEAEVVVGRGGGARARGDALADGGEAMVAAGNGRRKVEGDGSGGVYGGFDCSGFEGKEESLVASERRTKGGGTVATRWAWAQRRRSVWTASRRRKRGTVAARQRERGSHGRRGRMAEGAEVVALAWHAKDNMARPGWAAKVEREVGRPREGKELGGVWAEGRREREDWWPGGTGGFGIFPRNLKEI
uniref:DUF834 domain-containing protein n=1 Tax=Oryza glumipatula TaxID=40148 RepID=A0A0D9YS89_9ORYZ